MTTDEPNLDLVRDTLPANTPSAYQKFAEIAEKDADSDRMMRERFMRNVTLMSASWLAFVAGSIIACLAIVACGLLLPPAEYLAAVNTGPPFAVGGLLYIIARYLFPHK